MSWKFRFTALAISLAIPFLGVAGDNDDANGENRCDGLGSGCVCAESMNSNQSITSGNFDLNNSSDAKECSGFDVADSGAAAMVQASAMGTAPAFGVLPSTNYVAKIDQSGNGANAGISLWADSVTCSNCTVCGRYYASFASDYAAPNNHDLYRHKWVRPGQGGSDTDGDVNVQIEWQDYGTNPTMALDFGNGTVWGETAQDPPNIANQVSWSDLKVHAHRVEVCTDHSTTGMDCCGTALTANKLCVRFRMTDIVSGDKTEGCMNSGSDTHGQQKWSGTTAGGGLLDWYDQNTASGGTNDQAYFAYVMQSQVPVDPKFWIGPATEVEGVTHTCTDQVDCLTDCYANTDGALNDVPCTGGSTGRTCANAACRDKWDGDGVPIRGDVRSFDFDAPPLYYAGRCTSDPNRWCNVDSDCSPVGGTCNLSARIGAGAPYYGPWSDKTGGAGTCNLGYNSYFRRTHDDEGNGADYTSAGYKSGEPGITSTLVPCSCDVGVGAHCPALGLRRSDNLYNVQDDSAHVLVARTGSEFDVDADGAGIPDTPGTNDNRGVWDGTQSIGWRIPASPVRNEEATSGKKGLIRFGAEYQRLGITVMMAYADNYWTSGAGTNQNKHEEFATGSNVDSRCSLAWTSLHGAGGVGGGICVSGANIGQRCNPDVENVCGGDEYTTCSLSHGLPFKVNLFTHSGSRTTYPGCVSGTGYADCKSACAAGTITKGQCSCDNSGNMTIIPDLSFVQATDAPLGDWHCMKIDWNYNSGNQTLTFKRWLNSDAASPNLVDMVVPSNDLTLVQLNQFIWNAYANKNSPAGGTGGTTADTYRAMDNMVVRLGDAPVPCWEVGYGSAAAAGGGGGGGGTPDTSMSISPVGVIGGSKGQ
jgi:hypothetical protein